MWFGFDGVPPSHRTPNLKSLLVHCWRFVRCECARVGLSRVVPVVLLWAAPSVTALGWHFSACLDAGHHPTGLLGVNCCLCDFFIHQTEVAYERSLTSSEWESSAGLPQNCGFWLIKCALMHGESCNWQGRGMLLASSVAKGWISESKQSKSTPCSGLSKTRKWSGALGLFPDLWSSAKA